MIFQFLEVTHLSTCTYIFSLSLHSPPTTHASFISLVFLEIPFTSSEEPLEPSGLAATTTYSILINLMSNHVIIFSMPFAFVVVLVLVAAAVMIFARTPYYLPEHPLSPAPPSVFKGCQCSNCSYHKAFVTLITSTRKNVKSLPFAKRFGPVQTADPPPRSIHTPCSSLSTTPCPSQGLHSV